MANISPSTSPQGPYPDTAVSLVVRTRLASQDDLAKLLRLELRCFGTERFSKQVVEAFLRRDDCFVLVAEEKGRTVGAGMCVYCAHSGEGRIASVAVDTRHRGKGIGRSLLSACERRLLGKGVSEFTLEVETSNETAIALYLAHGYQLKGIAKDYYSKGRDAYVMSKAAISGKRTKVRVS